MNRIVGALAIAFALVSCASRPPLPDAAPAAQLPLPAAPLTPAPSSAAAVVAVAESQIGAPYRFGGASPLGFDCSGLVFFANAQLNRSVPRTVAELRLAARAVSRRDLTPGDLVFFSVARRAPDHVGIYAGGDRFVHAPSSGRVVSYGYLGDPYYARRYRGAGRLPEQAQAGKSADDLRAANKPP